MHCAGRHGGTKMNKYSFFPLRDLSLSRRYRLGGWMNGYKEGKKEGREGGKTNGQMDS